PLFSLLFLFPLSALPHLSLPYLFLSAQSPSLPGGRRGKARVARPAGTRGAGRTERGASDRRGRRPAGPSAWAGDRRGRAWGRARGPTTGAAEHQAGAAAAHTRLLCSCNVRSNGGFRSMEKSGARRHGRTTEMVTSTDYRAAKEKKLAQAMPSSERLGSSGRTRRRRVATRVRVDKHELRRLAARAKDGNMEMKSELFDIRIR
ncbi:unnamed protein product, partial [Urochloa humidicola]